MNTSRRDLQQYQFSTSIPFLICSSVSVDRHSFEPLHRHQYWRVSGVQLIVVGQPRPNPAACILVIISPDNNGSSGILVEFNLATDYSPVTCVADH